MIGETPFLRLYTEVQRLTHISDKKIKPISASEAVRRASRGKEDWQIEMEIEERKKSNKQLRKGEKLDVYI